MKDKLTWSSSLQTQKPSRVPARPKLHPDRLVLSGVLFLYIDRWISSSLMITTLIHHLVQGSSRIWSLYKDQALFSSRRRLGNPRPPAPKGSGFLVIKIVGFQTQIDRAFRLDVLTVLDRENALFPSTALALFALRFAVCSPEASL